MKLGEAILAALSREVKVPDGEEDDPNPLGYLLAEYPNFAEIVQGKRVLDFGCGYGNQGGAIEAKYQAKVTGLDIDENRLTEARRRYPRARFLSQIPDGERFDVVISQNAMEHFPDPAGVLEQMKSLVSPTGRILIAFGFPWWSPYGSHMHFFCRLPWLQLWFSERTIMRVRARYKSDGAMQFGEVEGGLNQMSLRKFNRLIHESGLKVHRMEYRAVKRQHWLMRIPLVREFFAGRVVSVLSLEGAQ